MKRQAWHLTGRGLQALPLDANINLDDLSRTWPSGFYTTFRTLDRGRRVVGLTRHLGRLFGPARAAGIQPVLAETDLRCLLDDIVAGWRPGEARLRLHLAQDGTFWLGAETFVPPAERLYREGVAALTVSFARQTPRLKRTEYIRRRHAALTRVRAAGAYEGLIQHHDRIWEGLTSNFCYVQEGVLGTAKNNILFGVTRAAVLQLARQLQIPRLYRALPVSALPNIDEAFLCSSSRGPMPIVRIDGHPIGRGRPGPLTQRLRAAYLEAQMHLAEPFCPARQNI